MFIALCSAIAASASLTLFSPEVNACSRILYVGNDSLRIVGRSLDWKTPIPTNIYVYPRGIAKRGHSLPGAVEWVSKYGAVYAVGYDGGITEGMNEKGLVVNGLFCKGAVYDNDSTAGMPPMSMSMFVGWLLDLNATTPEVVRSLRERKFSLSGATFDGGTATTLHWGVTDAAGRCAVIEFVDGELNIYEGHDMPAMTNDPNFPQMNAINDYWKDVGGSNMLPGTVKSPDRFVRGYYFDNHVEKTADAELGFAICRSILVNVSVPYLYTVESEPNVSSTQWRSFSDLRSLRYYFDIVTNMGVFYIDLGKCNLRKGAPVMKLDTSHSSKYVGEINSQLRKSSPFTPFY